MNRILRLPHFMILGKNRVFVFVEASVNRIRSIDFRKLLLTFSKICILFLILIGVNATIVWGYSFEWTGFGEKLYSNGQLRTEKSLWDWMELLIIPLVLAVGGLLYNHAEQRRTRDSISEQTQEQALRYYFDDMTDLLINKDLRHSDLESEKRIVARAKTLAVLRTLNGERKGLLLRFLYEAKLINSESPIINLADADFSNARLSYTDLSGANLQQAFFRGAQLRSACLNNANLKYTDLNFSVLMFAEINNASLYSAELQLSNLMYAKLTNSDLRNARLNESRLCHANLKGADLSYAALMASNLEEANLEDTDLEGTFIQRANLEKASLKGAKVWYTFFDQAKISKAQLQQTIEKKKEKRDQEKEYEA